MNINRPSVPFYVPITVLQEHIDTIFVMTFFLSLSIFYTTFVIIRLFNFQEVSLVIYHPPLLVRHEPLKLFILSYRSQLRLPVLFYQGIPLTNSIGKGRVISDFLKIPPIRGSNLFQIHRNHTYNQGLVVETKIETQNSRLSLQVLKDPFTDESPLDPKGTSSIWLWYWFWIRDTEVSCDLLR